MIASTEQSIWLRIISAVLPMMNPGKPVRPTVPMTIRSASICLASAGISLCAPPFTKCVWGFG
ncbi:hypothetical protein THIOM_000708 [Candidatus Thiomargarita nelsonii]|uniref:Uncharacterized protein n=1 Tax=Candidatus Thiomargarita nelsonii TaxID=1003181 RepID=A0A176S630_9GAMM|nr:hypothetical protein THIOM_000708 [Candidatus Thiomargarita nelsonii]